VDGVLRWSQGDRWFGRVTVVEQHGRSSVPSSRLANLRAALGFLQLPPRAPELQLLHRWLDTWIGLGQVVGGVERQGLRFSLSHIAEGEWRAVFMSNPMFEPAGFGVAKTPWHAVQRAAWAAVKRLETAGADRPRCKPREWSPAVSLARLRDHHDRAF
jgi:hypothetical protein